MIDADAALAIIRAHVQALPPQTIVLREALGRVLADDIRAPHDLPSFTSSAVDGYALRAAWTHTATDATPVTLRVTGEIRAGGTAPTDGVRRNPRRGAIRIYTGAPLPAGADAVVMQEDVTRTSTGITLARPVPDGANVRGQGAEFRSGDRVLAAGMRITPPVLALLAALGCARVRVHARPRIAVLATGDELRPVTGRIRAGQIRDSNTPMLVAALAACGISDVRTRAVRDDAVQVRRALRALLADADLVLTSGGISVGDHDHVRAAAADCGVTERFWKVAIKPGKPLYFGTGPAHLFALPGNPVAAMIGFHCFVRPALDALEGAAAAPSPPITARLAAPLRKKAGRMEFVRMRVEASADGSLPVAQAVRGQESHMLGGIATANALYRFASDATAVEEGAVISLESLHWSLP